VRTPYEIGRDAEYRVAKILAKRGYGWVIRSAASHGPIDLLASNGAGVIAVQVKKAGYVSRADVISLVEWSNRFNAEPYVARKRRGRWRLDRAPRVTV